MLVVLIIQTTVVFAVTAQKSLTQNGIASQSSYFSNNKSEGKPQNAINPPMSNEYSLSDCSITKVTERDMTKAWWMLEFYFGKSYITDITIYYRKDHANRMSGYKLYVTNTSAIPPVGYLCYEDPYSINGPFSNITQSIPCNQLGQYVIYYDTTGSQEDSGKSVILPVVELCYVAINGCKKGFWGSDCEKSCAESCIEQHCYPQNGSCIWGGCSKTNCLRSNCDKDTGICTEGCTINRTGPYCNKYSIASNSLILIRQNIDERTSLVSDGNKNSCVTLQGSKILVQVDLKEISIVTEIYFNLNVSSALGGNHTVYVSNANYNSSSDNRTVLYSGEFVPTLINVTTVFRYLIYQPPNQTENFSFEICEIGIVGCHSSVYGPLCDFKCPMNCRGPCDLETGNCSFGCLNGWSGDRCEKDVECITIVDSMTCTPLPVQVYPSTGPVNGGTLISVTGKFLGNDTDSISVEISGVICHNVTVTVPGTK